MISTSSETVRQLGRDLRFVPRVYRGYGFSAALAVIALGLAIGASTGVFSVVNALLLRSLPFADPARLVELWRSPVSPANGRTAFVQWREHSSYLESAAAFSSSEMNLVLARDAMRVKVAETSANFFALLGTSAVSGRTFAPDEDLPGRTAVAVISHSLWQQFFGGDPKVAGRTLQLNGAALTVAGVAPPRFDYPGNTHIWIPTIFDFERVPKRGAFLLQTIGRLRQGLGLQQAGENFAAEVRRLHPGSPTGDADRPRLISLRDQLAGPVGEAAWVLSGIVLLLLLAACANVAQLLLSRTTDRRQELALRAALGASRARLVQQLVTEATAFTVSGAVLGLVVAHWAARIASLAAPAQLATQQYTVLDWRVLGFAAGLALALGIVFGVIPAWMMGRLQPSMQVVRNAGVVRDRASGGMRRGLVALQAGLTVVLVAGSLTMGRAFLRLLGTGLGFQTENAVTLTVSLQGTKYRTGRAEWQYYSDMLERLRAMPGIEAAGAVGYLPLANNVYMAGAFRLDSGEQVQGVVVNGATPDYFRAMGTPFLAGRDFRPSEGRSGAAPVIVNQAFAQRTGAHTIVGRRLIAPWNRNPYVIIGVVATARLTGPAGAGAPQIYWPVEEEPPAALTFVARTRGPAAARLAACRDAVRALDREVPVYDVKTLEQRLDDVLARPRFYTTAILFFAGLAVLLAAIGIHGAASRSVSQRTHELGVRIAIGASHARVRAMMIRQTLMPIAFGLAAGIAGAIATGQYLEHLVVTAGSLGFAACANAAAFLLLLAALAAWSATARVLRIDPMDALRVE